MSSGKLQIEDFIEVLASKEPVPGGGGASALCAAIGTALGNMVGSLTVGKKKYAEVEDLMTGLKVKCGIIQKDLIELIDKDAECFLPLAEAYRLPKETPEQTVLAGKNGTHGPRSFVVGYNSTSVKNPHHRAASGLTMAEDPREQKHVLWGALAGGPDGNDAHSDSTNDWRENEVTIDYNAAFVGACAAMYEFYGTPDMAITENFPPEEVVDPDAEGSGYWVEAIAVDKHNSDGAGTTQVSIKVLTGVPKPLDKITVRYFFDVSECNNGIAGIDKYSELYDQSNAEDGEVGGDGVLTGPFKYDKKDNTYYIDITWDGYVIANSGKKYQFEIGTYYGDIWDPSNDWSYDGQEGGPNTR